MSVTVSIDAIRDSRGRYIDADPFPAVTVASDMDIPLLLAIGYQCIDRIHNINIHRTGAPTAAAASAERHSVERHQVLVLAVKPMSQALLGFGPEALAACHLGKTRKLTSVPCPFPRTAFTVQIVDIFYIEAETGGAHQITRAATQTGFGGFLPGRAAYPALDRQRQVVDLGIEFSGDFLLFFRLQMGFPNLFLRSAFFLLL